MFRQDLVQEEMNLDEWELVPKNNINDLDLDLDLDHDEEMIDYFICPSTQGFLNGTESPPRTIVVHTNLLQVPIPWEPVLDPILDPEQKQSLSNPSPRLSFNEMKETESVDMKIDTPERITSPLPHFDADDMKPSDSEGGDDLHAKTEVDDVTSDDQRLNLWKIGLNRIGGIAAAAATICVFFLGHKNIKISKNKNQTLRFQIYSDENKRTKGNANHTTKLNETILAMKGVPVVRAQISFGGHYDVV